MAREGAGRGLRRIQDAREDFLHFLHTEVGGSVVLLAATVAALAFANSSLAHSFSELWHVEIGVRVGADGISKSLLHWIDDLLMALFFFVVGLEIKREFVVGELRSARKAALPIIAAVGGMLGPALVYTLVTGGGAGSEGFGVPMATDIAFALGVLAILGDRVPANLRVFLVGLAIADDLGAVVIIALFYSSGVSWDWLGAALVLLGVLAALNWRDVQNPVPYFLIGLLVWFGFERSGVHATLAGVLVALTIPATCVTTPLQFVEWAKGKLNDIQDADIPGAHVLDDDSQQIYAGQLRQAAIGMQAPLQRLEFALHPVTTYVVLPLFALGNAGVALSAEGFAEGLKGPVSLGILLGLLVGKQVGITGFAWLAVRTRLAHLPPGVGWLHIYGASWLGGIGFTMSLFIAGLAFEDAALMSEAKLAILLTSVVAGLGGYLVLRFVAGPPLPVASTREVLD
jgi:NhaA family Na+:H+ antiporter